MTRNKIKYRKYQNILKLIVAKHSREKIIIIWECKCELFASTCRSNSTALIVQLVKHFNWSLNPQYIENFKCEFRFSTVNEFKLYPIYKIHLDNLNYPNQLSLTAINNVFRNDGWIRPYSIELFCRRLPPVIQYWIAFLIKINLPPSDANAVLITACQR